MKLNVVTTRGMKVGTKSARTGWSYKVVHNPTRHSSKTGWQHSFWKIAVETHFTECSSLYAVFNKCQIYWVFRCSFDSRCFLEGSCGFFLRAARREKNISNPINWNPVAHVLPIRTSGKCSASYLIRAWKKHVCGNVKQHVCETSYLWHSETACMWHTI